MPGPGFAEVVVAAVGLVVAGVVVAALVQVAFLAD